MKPSVRIMMATYNGEKYIRQQLDSIISQTYDNWSLIIQDDGSTDNTWNILKEYDENNIRISIRKSPEQRHGAYYNFHSIANQEKIYGTKFDYYMFCDQDDVWDTDKIEKILKTIEEYKSEKPLFCFADMRVIDDHSVEMISSICKAQGLKYINKESLFFSHIIYGCNTMMNKEAFFAVPMIDTTQDWVGILSHDNLYAKFSGMLGKVIFVPETTMGYRRHGGNVTAKQNYGFGIRRVLKRMLGIHELAKDHARTYNQSIIAMNLIRAAGYDMEVITDINMAIISGGQRAVAIIRKYHIGWGNRTKNISHKLILFLGIYRKYLMKISK